MVEETTMNNFKFDRDFGMAYNCRYGRYGPTAPAPLLLFAPLYAMVCLWAWAIRRWRLLLVMLALVGCQSQAPISPPPTPAISSQATDAYRVTRLLPERNLDDEIYIECQLRHGDGEVIAERKWFQALDASAVQLSWVVDGARVGPYGVYCRARHVSDYYLYPFGSDQSSLDGWQFIESWYVSESRSLFYLPIVWKRGRG